MTNDQIVAECKRVSLESASALAALLHVLIREGLTTFDEFERLEKDARVRLEARTAGPTAPDGSSAPPAPGGG